jgi:hypothetical protein
MNWSKAQKFIELWSDQKFIELWTNQKQTGESALVQSKDTKRIYINSIRIIKACVTVGGW